jgi:hypothetical protein
MVRPPMLRGEESPVPTFQHYIDDDRYRTPTLLLVTVETEARARELAEDLMRAPHHRGVEVWDGDTRLFGLGTMAEPGKLAPR